MEEHQAQTARSRWMDRPTTRRALLAGTATIAAAGTAAAIVGVATRSDGFDAAPTSGSPGDQAGGGVSAPAPDLDRPIEDPKRRAAHLLRRAGFGGTRAQIDEFATLSREDAADRLLNFAAVDNSALDARVAVQNFNLTTPGRVEGKGPLLQDMQRWWLTRMAYTARPLEERMTLIWHGLLTSQTSKIGGQRAKLMVRQNELFRTHALPRYDDLLHAIGKDPAMLIYLDTVESTNAHPNENYARELMELYSMGVGNYTEDDVRESARAFTGWRLNAPIRQPIPEGLSEQERQQFQNNLYAEYVPEFMVQRRLQDTGTKTFLGRTGNFDGDDIVDIIMEQPATGRYMARRLFTEFANYNPSDETVGKLTAIWDGSGHQVKDVVRAILMSDEFYSERSYRAIVRSPVELVVNMVRALEIETDFKSAMGVVRGMDQILFEPPSVAGWPGGAVWLSSSTFFGRINFLDQFLLQRGRPVAIPALAAAPTANDAVDRAVAVLVDDNLAEASRQSLYAYASTITNAQERAAAIAYLVLASPEYQLV